MPGYPGQQRALWLVEAGWTDRSPCQHPADVTYQWSVLQTHDYSHLVNSAGPDDDGLVRPPLPLPTEGVEAQAVQAEGPEEGEPEEEAALALGPGLERDEEDEESGDKSH